MGQNAEVMPRPLNLSLVIHSLEVRTIFSLFVLKKHMLAVCFLWLSSSGHYRVNDEALLAETT